MRYIDGRCLFSPSDLVEFMESPFASWMSRSALDRPELRPGPDPRDPAAVPGIEAVLQRRGFEHERRVLEALGREGRAIVSLDPKAADALAETERALRAGSDVLYQATLSHAGFAGIADFLVRVPGASALGHFHYEVWDAKLARRAKPTHVLQLCAYAEMLEALQGRRPVYADVLLYTGRERLRLDDYFAFYTALRRAFLAALERFDPSSPPPPSPGAEHRRWQEAAERWLAERDDVSRVAYLTQLQARRLAAAGITSLGALADTAVARVAGIEDRVLGRLREQAALQRESAGRVPPCYRVLAEAEMEEGRGLALLPPASPGDGVLDLEGDPLERDGLEYLWGAAWREADGSFAYTSLWAHDRAGERGALVALFDALQERRARHPDLHVYHYGTYELTALKRLAAREGVGEEVLDALLRAEVFVDLYPIVRHGVRVGEPAYSLKNVERLVRPARAGEVASGMESAAVYDAWRESAEGATHMESPLLERIRCYNEEDCRSTLELAHWLRERQTEARIAHRPRRARRSEAVVRPEPDEWRRRRELAERMRARIPADPSARTREADRWRIQEMLAALVEFHRREAKPEWWELYAHAALDETERAEQPDCLAGLRRTPRPRFAVKRSWGYEYAYDPEQDTKIGIGDACRIAQAVDTSVTVDGMDPVTARIVLKTTDDALTKSGLDGLPDALCLIRFDHRGTREIESALEAIADTYDTSGTLPPALRDLLLRRPPRIRGHATGPIRRAGEPLSEAFLRATRDLEDSLLCVQGPPGSGKTTEGGKAIATLLRAGARIGIASNSHKAIVNLMNATARAAGRRLDCVKIGGEREDAPTFPGAQWEDESKEAAGWLDRVRLVGGTAWCFSRLVDRLDYLFVDEAGQVSLANLVSMSRSARNLVLIGDPCQLDQPTRGVHPGESGLSALEYALGGHATIPPEQGLFLEDTHRLHPDLCAFVSGAFYEDRLRPTRANERRVLAGAPAAGIAFVPVRHEGNRQASDEEVAAVVQLVNELVGRPYTDREGETKPLEAGDLLVVAPYNLQVRKLAAALPLGVRVGTVDRFQGQEAPVVIVSMCASEPHLSARGMAFLFHPNRLNVALSRAQCLAIVVGEPRLGTAVCRSLAEMRLVNRMCRLLAEAAQF